MDNNKFDEYMKQTLKEDHKVDDLQKENMWHAIEKEIEMTPQKLTKTKWKPLMITVAASILLIMGFLNTPPGHALVDNVKQMFAPEKQVKIPMEGSEEEETATLNDQSEKGYVIYVDEEHYKMEEKKGYDIITPKEPLPEHFPEVFMKIIHVENQNVEETISKLEAEHGITFEQTDYPIASQTARTLEGHEWNSELNKYFVIADESGGSYIFHQRYFLEAAEGHGVRLSEMLKDFHIVAE
ncbi:hypothetical protein [Pseudalkalibacillus berkeleyi]|uniref:DUF4367 domain-containing protein n=1 Tax=Pseudalkalibacillus berkeleyi TaxID=1069813 RepID=A0ABS9H0G9_9BACL|nr:hypothetical protein [Pseudalkalibacillus berkeleyi]MCF6138493.1 hypothetical protein [Pseudalkalibacillus berkeleyi]